MRIDVPLLIAGLALCLAACDTSTGADGAAGTQSPVDDLGPPLVTLLEPADGARYPANALVDVVAQVHDDGPVQAVLFWEYDGVAYGCPSKSPAALCTREGDRFHWRVPAAAGPRRFHIIAQDQVGQQARTEDRTVYVGDVEAPEVEDDGAPPLPEEEAPPSPGEDDEDEGAPPPPEDDGSPGAPPPPEEEEDDLDPEERPRPPPPNTPDAPEADGTPPIEDNGVPTIEVLDPADGSVHVANGAIDIRARITDVEGLTSAALVWAFNGERYRCPTDEEDVVCAVDGDVHHWTITVGAPSPRPFRISARNSRGRSTVTPERTLNVVADPDARPPEVTLLEPTPETVWPANSIVDVVARATDADGRISEVALLWDFNGNEYPCPHRSQYVDCDVEGDRYAWRVQVGTGVRSFRVRATDDQQNQTLSDDRSLELQE